MTQDTATMLLDYPTPATIEPAVGKQQIRRAFWSVVASFLVHGLVVSTWVSRIASIKSSLALSDGTLGLALLGTAIGSVTAIPICGWLVNRYGTKRTAMWSGIGFSAALALPALAFDGASLFAMLLFYGAMAGANDVAINAQAVTTEKLIGAPVISRFHGMFSLGGILGASAGGYVAVRGATTSLHLAAASGVILVLSWWMSRLTIDSHEPRASSQRLALKRIPMALFALSAIGFCIFLSEGAIADWTAVYLKQVLQAGDGVAAAGYAVFSTAMAIFRFAGDAITMRIGPAWTVRGGGIVAGIGMAIVVFASSPCHALAGFALAGAGFSSIVPVAFAAGGRIPSVSSGVGVATVSGLGYLGFLVGPPAIGFVSEITSLRASLFLLVVLSAVAASLAGAAELKR